MLEEDALRTELAGKSCGQSKPTCMEKSQMLLQLFKLEDPQRLPFPLTILTGVCSKVLSQIEHVSPSHP